MNSHTQSPDLVDGSAEGLSHALEAALTEREALAKHARALESLLADTRARPLKSMKEFVVFHLLQGLSRMAPPLPRRTAMRFARSALKRDPMRSLHAHDGKTMNEAATRKRGGYTLRGRVARDPTRPDILVVSHEASRTGAPILALNLVEHLGRRFNVTCYLVRGGECVEDFTAASVRVFVGEGLPRETQDGLVQSICGETRFAFAIVNSAESHGVLAALRRAEVPTVSLVHEFASLIRPTEVLDRLVRHSDQLVFSSTTTRESARAAHPGFASASVHVIPQGKCRVPTRGSSQATHAQEQDFLRRTLRPVGRDGCVVLGAGTVNLRKGVDLFVEMALRVLSRTGGEEARFYWIGGGFDLKSNDIYIAHLQDQLSRAGVGDRVTMLRATAEIETAYALADVLIVPSRLDPLPNVGLDAMAAGVPVVCFDRATGLAEQLDAAGVRDHCVADYLDCSDMAAKVRAFACSAELRAEVGSRLRTHAETKLDFAAYAGQIAALGLSARARVEGGP